MIRIPLVALAAMLPLGALAQSADSPRYGGMLEGFEYPWPVKRHAVKSQGQSLEMAYLDIAPTPRANGRSVVLLHGKNFTAATWESQINALTKTGYRVIAPDQIGFGKSSKPAMYQYSFAQLAANTRGLLDALGIARSSVMGHSMGGMLAVRYALQYPTQTEQLLLVNPIGLEDWKSPFESITC